MKKALIIVLALVILAVALTGANKWPAKVWIYNGDDASTAYFNFEGDEYPIVQLTVLPGESKLFSFPRGVWDGKLTYCGATESFEIDARHNVWLNLPSCANQHQRYQGWKCTAWNADGDCITKVTKLKTAWFGEPSMEKYYMSGSVPQEWKFQY